MLLIFLIPFLGLILAILINHFLPRARFRGYDCLPFFFLPTCNLITSQQNNPSFLPYGFLFYFILVIIVSIQIAVKNRNISLGKTFHRLWGYLSLCSVLWYIGLLFFHFL